MAGKTTSIEDVSKPMPILPLAHAVREQIKSSIQISTLSDAVEELFKNSLDADAANVDIEVDFAKGFCSVKDDGVGIHAAAFSHGGNLAQPNCTSKLHSSHAYGRRGCFLSHLASISLTSIQSRRDGQDSTNTAFLGHSTVLSRNLDTEGDTLSCRGTSVIVHNLFGNLPVRFKRNALRYAVPAEEEKAFSDLKRRLVAYLLALNSCPNTRLRSRGARFKYAHQATNDGNRESRNPFSLPKIESILRQANLTHQCDYQTWKLSSAKAGATSIRAAICLVPSPSKRCQFISAGHFPLPSSGAPSLLYDTVNAAFDLSDFGSLDATEEAARGHTVTRNCPDYKQSSLKGKTLKGVDRWPRFYIKIDAKSNQSEPANENTVASAVPNVLGLLNHLIVQFLQTQNFKPKKQNPLERKEPISANSVIHRPIGRSYSIYGSWNRLKHSSHFQGYDTRDGLPFAGKVSPSVDEIILGEDARLLLRDMELDSECSDLPKHTTRDGGVDIVPSQPAEQDDSGADGILTWTDFRTGQPHHVDLENGFVMPQQHHNLQHVQDIKKHRRRLLVQPSTTGFATTLEHWPAFRPSREKTIASTKLLNEAAIANIQQPSVLTVQKTLDAQQLASAVALNQVDTKFIFAILFSRDGPATLIVIDQHAADERIKVEKLYRQLCAREAVAMAKPIKFEVTAEELARFRRRQQDFAEWAINYDCDVTHNALQIPTVTVTHLPTIIAERCRLEPKILIDLLRREIWSTTGQQPISIGQDDSWMSKLSSCPNGLVQMINSRACRTAIMFNEALTQEQCGSLLQQLSRCTLPFRCAHGRPSTAVVGSLGNINLGYGEGEEFGDAFQRWC